MSRWEFMRQLEELLSDISPSEREEALQYYNDYFNDAGRENEQSVIEALGSPKQVAEIVKEGLGSGVGQGEFTECGFMSNSEEENKNEIIKSTGTKSSTAYDTEKAEDETASFKSAPESEPVKREKAKKEDMPVWAIVLIVIGCIILSPAILGAIASGVGVLAGIILLLFGLILGFGVTAVILLIVGFGLAIAGIGTMITDPLSAVGLIGAGFICAAIGILFMLLTVLIVGKAIPGLCKGITHIYNKIFSKKEEAKI